MEWASFVGQERERFVVEDSNLFAFSFSKVSVYRADLDFILERYKQSSAEFIGDTQARQERIKQGSQDRTDSLRNSWPLQQKLHLDVESFYIFAKILLDHIARAIQFYFGQAQGVSLQLHDRLAKFIERYASAKGLDTVPQSLLSLIKELKAKICDYRDKQIEHENSPRTIKGTMYMTDGAESWITITRLYPTKTDTQVEGQSPTELIERIDDYMKQVIQYISQNHNKTSFKIEG